MQSVGAIMEQRCETYIASETVKLNSNFERDTGSFLRS